MADDGRRIVGPAPVVADPAMRLGDYWRARLTQATFRDHYAGAPISKLPEDLRVYEHLLWAQRPTCVIEIGIGAGGSSLWFRDRLRALGTYGEGFTPRVICVDIDTGPAREQLARALPGFAEEIVLIEADVREPGLADRVAAEVDGRSCLVVEDGAHTFETTLAALEEFARFVPPAGFLVVEDGVVDREELRLLDDWPRGVSAATERWLASEEGAAFERCPELEVYGITSHPGGFFQRRA